MTIFRCDHPAVLALLFLTGCGGPPVHIECNIDRNSSGRAIVSPDVFAVLTADLVEDIDDARNKLTVDPALVGFRGAISRQFSGTDAHLFAMQMNLLRSRVARQKARELALANEGDTLLGTKHDWECKTFANSVASLDLGQSQNQLLNNLTETKAHFQRVCSNRRRRTTAKAPRQTRSEKARKAEKTGTRETSKIHRRPCNRGSEKGG